MTAEEIIITVIMSAAVGVVLGCLYSILTELRDIRDILDSIRTLLKNKY